MDAFLAQLFPQRPKYTSVQSLCASSAGESAIEHIPDVIESHLWGNQEMLREIIEYFESVEFDVKLGVVNTEQLKQVLDETPEVQDLTKLCHDRACAVFILGHMIYLSTKDFNSRYRNVYETAVVAYLHCLTSGRTDLNKAAIAAAKLLKGSSLPSRYIRKFLE